MAIKENERPSKQSLFLNLYCRGDAECEKGPKKTRFLHWNHVLIILFNLWGLNRINMDCL
ncbi:hypothetical protein BVX98_01415 [bacterium F11]|nr:hypothetical protein BVX98_01415 [bacterium F11]